MQAQPVELFYFFVFEHQDALELLTVLVEVFGAIAGKQKKVAKPKANGIFDEIVEKWTPGDIKKRLRYLACQ